MSAKRGAAQSEVIQQWADMDSEGATFERHRMDAQLQSICITDPAGVPDSLKDLSKGIKVKPSDVSFLVSFSYLTVLDATICDSHPHGRVSSCGRRWRRELGHVHPADESSCIEM